MYNQSMGYLGSSGIEGWRLFNSILTTGMLYSVKISSSGDIYVGGSFSTINGVPANNIAVYRDGSWYSLGSGCNSTVNEMLLVGTDLYVVGSFTSAGDVADTVYIAKWDGSTWTPLGKGCSASAGGLAYCNGALYVSGNFISVGNTVANDVTVNQIAKWQDGTWYSLGSGVPSGYAATTIAASGTDLYVCGNFSTLHGTPGYVGLAKLNTTSNEWSNPGVGLIGGTHSIVIAGSVIYAGGQEGSPGLPNLIKIDGANRTILGYSNSNVESLALIGNNLYAGGLFTGIGSTSGGPYVDNTTGVARYDLDSSTWYSIGTPVGTSAYSLAASDDGTLYIPLSGTPPVTPGQTTTNLLKWENSTSTLTRVANGLVGSPSSSSVIRAIKYHNGALYVGGTFKVAGGVYSSGIAKYSGGVWEGFGTGLTSSGVVYAIEVIGTDLYIGGTFTSVDGVLANRIAKWNGTSWSALQNGCNGDVNALASIGSDLYVGGAFTSVGLINTRIAKWSGGSWAQLGTGITSGSVLSLAASESDLYVGGTFTSAGGAPSTQGVAKWSSNSWTSLGLGCGSGGVYALALSGTDLYVGGNFTALAGSTPNTVRVAKWDTLASTDAGWSSVMANGGVSGGILYAIDVLNNNVLYLGGAFTSVAGVTAGKCAKWNGSTMALTMAGGTPTVYAIDSNSIGVYIGGGFTTAAGNPSPRLAWHGIS